VAQFCSGAGYRQDRFPAGHPAELTYLYRLLYHYKKKQDHGKYKKESPGRFTVRNPEHFK
jgi:hypothetical protein